jgi:cell wall-associated NlpC family hydrolase
MEFSNKKQKVMNVQKALGLTADGVDGPKTWNAIEDAVVKDKPQPTPSAPTGNTIAEKLVALAKKEVGVEEVNGTNCGPRVNEYKAATWLDSTKSWPWCAAFICWLFREAMKDGKYTFKRPQTAGAYDFENWCRQQDSSVSLKKPHSGDIKSGDIVIFNFSHIGIAVGSPDSDGYVKTIEGNTDGAGSREGGAVLEKRRKISSIRSRIRVNL